MTQTSLPWDGKLAGDSGPYTSDRWSAMYRSMSPDTASSAVLWSTTSENLKATISGSAVTISEGSAMVYGRYYNNSAEESFQIPISATGRTDMVVLRATWGSTKTVRLAYLTGTDGSATPPALTQVAGSVWEVPLYEIDAQLNEIYRDRRSLWQACTLIHREDFFSVGSPVSSVTVNNLPGVVSRYNVIISGSLPTTPGSLRATFNGITTADYMYSIDGASYASGSNFYMGSYSDNFTAQLDIHPNYIREASIGGFGITAISRMIADYTPKTVMGVCYGSEPAGLRNFEISVNSGTFVHAVSVYAFS